MGLAWTSSSSPGSRSACRSIWRRINAARAQRCSDGTPATRSRSRSAIAGACSSSGPFPIGRLPAIRSRASTIYQISRDASKGNARRSRDGAGMLTRNVRPCIAHDTTTSVRVRRLRAILPTANSSGCRYTDSRHQSRILLQLTIEKSVTDYKANPIRPDRSRIRLEEEYTLRSWAKSLGVSKQELAAAVRAVGTSVEEVKEYLRQWKQL
jgi:hypothetical protein